MDGSMTILNLITLGCGIYILYTWFKLHIAGRLFPNSLLIPKDKEPKDCLDAPGYIAYLKNKLLVTGIAVTVSGAFITINDLFGFFDTKVTLILTGLSFLVIVWYMVYCVKATRLYW